MKRFTKIALLTLVVLLAAEIGARVIDPYIEDPVVWYNDEAQVKAAQVGQVGQVDVVFTGTSMMRDALDVSKFTETSGLTGYNAALSNGVAPIQQRWLTEVVIPELRPDVVVWGLTSFDLNGSSPRLREAIDAYETAPRADRSVVGRLDAWLAERSTLVKLRPNLRVPGELADGISRARDGEAEPDPVDGIPGRIDALGSGIARRDAQLQITEQQVNQVKAQALFEFTIAPDLVAAVESTIALLQADGIEVVLVAMPVTTEYIAIHEDASDYSAFLAALTDIARKHDVELVDMGHRYPDERFADIFHLNGTGTAAFSEAMARLLTGGEAP